jgi:diguanylate cyclase (GGDEF)-like protein
MLIGADGSCRWASKEWPADAAAAIDGTIADALLGEADGAGDVRTIGLTGDRTLYRARAVAKGSDHRAGTLLVVADGKPDAELSAAIQGIASLVATIDQLNVELDQMAVELSNRYEELNLVYATSRDDSDAHDGRVSLENLVKHCCKHLGASLAALVLPRPQLALEAHEPHQPLRDIGSFLRVVASDFFVEFERGGRAVVCNEDLGAAPALARFGPMKLAATPVRNGNDAVCGVLLMVNPLAAADFRNSDKNLLASMADKAAKLVERSYDSLTGLLSRWEFERRIGSLLAKCRESQGPEHVVLSIDVDELRVVNETLGAEAGDAALRGLARLLASQQRSDRVIARLDGDDFALLLENCSLAAGRVFAENLCGSIRRLPLSVDGKAVSITASIGVTLIVPDFENAAAVMHAAELARTAAHDTGRDRVHVYQENAATLVQRNEEMRWVGRIHSALRADRFRIYGQLIQPLGRAAEPHIEVLLRLIDDDGALVSPGSFLPAAERFHLMPAIDRWVITRTLALLGAQRAGVPLCAINLSGQSLSDESFLEFILAELDRSKVPCGRICFEITETVAIKSIQTAKQFMLLVKDRGCHFSLDDFGTGLSSFSYLKALPFDFVKIDGSFVRGILEDRVSQSMVWAITEVGHAMGLGIIAEYVENAAIRDKLTAIGVDFAQGYAIEQPIPLVEHFDRHLPAVNA